MGYDRGVSPASFWIFGYGSLVWRPAFPHLRSRVATIAGYVRRFWQGSTDHRGWPDRPGRVVTLLPDQHESLGLGHVDRTQRCWGTAYEIPLGDPEKVLAGLDHRERGGYDRVEVEISLFDGSLRPGPSVDRGAEEPPAVAGLVYIASPENTNYLGAASIEEIARQVASASGPSGANSDYVFELARSLRGMGAADSHVFAVETELTRLLAKRPVDSE